jgi:hypothetical protein
VGVYFPPVQPPINVRAFIGEGCGVTCTSFISQEDANLCAAALATQCSTGGGGGGGTPQQPPVCVADCVLQPPPVVPPVDPPPTGTPCNNPQTACTQCPDGTEFCYTVPRCTFFAATLEQANAIALSYAQQQAIAVSFCFNGSLPGGCINVPYSAGVSVSGGTGPFVWTMVSGTLPVGLTATVVNGTRTLQLAGTPTSKTSYTFSFRVEDPAGNFIVREFFVSIIGFNVSSPPDGEIGEAYSHQFLASGGTGLFIYTVASGTLPPGLTLTLDGLLSGTPTTNGSYDFVIRATDINSNQFCDKLYTINIGAECEIIGGTFSEVLGVYILPTATVINSFSTTLTTTLSGVGGGDCYWNVTAGTLPPGITLTLLGQAPDCHGLLSGVPTNNEDLNDGFEDYYFTISVQSAANPSLTCSKDFTMRVLNPCGDNPIHPVQMTWQNTLLGCNPGNTSSFVFTDGAHASFTFNSDAAGGDPNRCFGGCGGEFISGICNPIAGAWMMHAKFTVTGSLAPPVACTDGAPNSKSHASVSLTNNAGTITYINQHWCTNPPFHATDIVLPAGPFSGTVETDILVPSGPATLSFFLQVTAIGGAAISGTFELTPSMRP